MTRSLSTAVVVAVWDHTQGLSDCINELGAQLRDRDELIVVSSIRLPDDLLKCFENSRFLLVDSELLIPELWGRGMSNATTDIVAITTSHFLPKANWLEEIRKAHQKFDTPAIGGAIEPPGKASATGTMSNWATYFLRYSQYLRYVDEQSVDDLAGDNASYKRYKLKSEDLEYGFWELHYHRRIVGQGELLMFVPKIRVIQNAGFGFVGFMRQRFHHGIQFGQTRSKQWGIAWKVAAISASPLIPIVLFAKILVRVLRGRRYIGAFLFTLPALFSFILAWALGEALGYMWPVCDNRY